MRVKYETMLLLFLRVIIVKYFLIHCGVAVHENYTNCRYSRDITVHKISATEIESIIFKVHRFYYIRVSK